MLLRLGQIFGWVWTLRQLWQICHAAKFCASQELNQQLLRFFSSAVKTTTPSDYCKISKLILHILLLTILGIHWQLPDAINPITTTIVFHHHHHLSPPLSFTTTVFHHHRLSPPPPLITTTTTTTTSTNLPAYAPHSLQSRIRKHKKRAQMGAFFMSGTPHLPKNTRNTPAWASFSCSAPSPSPFPRTPITRETARYWCLTSFPFPIISWTSKTRSKQRVFVFAGSLSSPLSPLSSLSLSPLPPSSLSPPSLSLLSLPFTPSILDTFCFRYFPFLYFPIYNSTVYVL